MTDNLKKPELILFDLDGTLTDPGLGITNSAMYALKKMGREVPPREELYFIIGPPLRETFANIFGFRGEEIDEGVRNYREYFRETGLFENEVYPGIPEMLETLKTSGYRLAVATSKPEIYALQILEHFGLADWFDGIYGASLDDTRGKKEEVITYALENLGVADPEKVLMVGDREYDVLGAHSLGFPCMGVLFGYGSREELEAAGADLIAETPEEIAARILKIEPIQEKNVQE